MRKIRGGLHVENTEIHHFLVLTNKNFTVTGGLKGQSFWYVLRGGLGLGLGLC